MSKSAIFPPANLSPRAGVGGGMNLPLIIGSIASLCSMASFAPQAWKIIKTRDTSSISARMYILTVTGFGFWLAYGLLLGEGPIIVTNGVCLVLSGFILYRKLRG